MTLVCKQAELTTSQREVKEREKRIAELEESLQGTMHLVRQKINSTTIIGQEVFTAL